MPDPIVTPITSPIDDHRPSRRVSVGEETPGTLPSLYALAFAIMGITRYLLPATPRSQFVASLLFYTALTAVIGRDVLSQLSTSIANDAGDPLLTAAILHWNAHHLPWTEAWWQFPIFHPTRDTLAFSEHLLGLSAIAAPLDWVTGNAVVTYNLVTLLTFVFSCAAMYLLVYRLSGSASAALVAGLAFGFAPFRVSQLPHIQMLASFWAPLALLGLHAFLDTGRRRWLVLYGGAWALQAAANGYALIFFSVLVGFWVLWFVVLRGRWKDLGLIAAATIVAAIPLAPILATYIAVHEHHGFSRDVQEIQGFSADVAGLLCAPGKLTFWAWLRVGCRPEGELFPGVALFLLTLAAALTVFGIIGRAPAVGSPRAVVWIRRLAFAVAVVYGAIAVSVMVFGRWRIEWSWLQASASSTGKPLVVMAAGLVIALLLSPGLRAAARRSSTMGFYLLAAFACWLLSLGPQLVLMGESTNRHGPYSWLMLLPGVDGLRAPARFWVMSTICLAVAAGLYLAGALAGRSRRAAATALLVLVPAVAADGWISRIPAAPLPPPAPQPGRLAGQRVIELPLGGVWDIPAPWRAVTGGWTSVNGYSGYGPPYYTALTESSETGDAAAFTPFQRDRDLHVLVRADSDGHIAMVERQPGVEFVARNQWFRQYRLPRRAAPPETIGAGVTIASLDSNCAGHTARFAMDGDETTRWVCPPIGLQELRIDLGQPVTIGAFVQRLGAYYWEMPRTMIIETSLDNERWTVVKNGSVLEAAIDGGLREPRSAPVVVAFAPHVARYLKIRVENQVPNFHFTMAEAEVRAPAP